MMPMPPLLREVVALGGPNAQDQPDLFMLVEKEKQQQQQQHGLIGQHSNGNSDATIANKAAANYTRQATIAAPEAAPEWTDSKEGSTGVNSEQSERQQQRGVGVVGAKSEGVLLAADTTIAEDNQASLSIRGKQRNETAVVAEEEWGGVELEHSLQKCPW